MRKILGFLLCLSVVAATFGIQTAFAAQPEAVDLKVDEDMYCVDVDGTQTVKAVMVYSDGSEKQIIDVKRFEANRELYTNEYLKNNNIQIVREEIAFKLSDEKSAKIDSNGLITGISEGNSVVTVTCGVRKVTADVSVTRIKELEAKSDIPKDKIWVINFHKNVTDSSVTDKCIFVYDDKNQKVAVGVNTCSDRRIAVITPPAEGYHQGGTYTLYMGGSIKFKDKPGTYLTNSYIMKFTVSQ